MDHSKRQDHCTEMKQDICIRNGLKCMYTNIDSLPSKKAELDFKVKLYNPDVIGLTEVKPKNLTNWHFCEQQLQIEGYVMYTNLNGRGSALYVREGMQSSEAVLDNPCESTVSCTIPLNKGKDRLLVVVIYRSPNSNDCQNKNLIELMEKIGDMTNSHKLIMGDFNLPEIDWNQQISRAPVGHFSGRFLESWRDCFFFQHIKEPTHFRGLQQANVLDLVITNEEGMLSDLVFGEPVGKSHHVVISWTFNCYAVKSSSSRMIYSYIKGNYLAMNQRFLKVPWQEMMLDRTVDEMWSMLSDEVLSAIEELVPHKFNNHWSKDRRGRPAWMNSQVSAVLKRKKQAFGKYKRTRDVQDYTSRDGIRDDGAVV